MKVRNLVDSWSESLRDYSQDVYEGCSHLQALWAQSSLPKWPIHMPVCWQEASITHHADLFMGLLECPYNVAVGFPQSEWLKAARWSHNIFCDLATEPTIFKNILLLHHALFIVYIVLFNVWREWTRVSIPGNENYWGSPCYLNRQEK